LQTERGLAAGPHPLLKRALLKTLMIALLGLGLAACGAEPTAPPEDPGTLYLLRSINGSPLPYTLGLPNGHRVVFRRGETFLANDGRVRDALVLDYVVPDVSYAGYRSERFLDGRWRRVDGELELTLSDGTTLSGVGVGNSLRTTRTIVVETDEGLVENIELTGLVLLSESVP
jgi:hypothetical protein